MTLNPDRFVSAREERAEEAWESTELAEKELKRLADEFVEISKKRLAEYEVDFSEYHKDWVKRDKDCGTPSELLSSLLHETLQDAFDVPSPSDAFDSVMEGSAE